MEVDKIRLSEVFRIIPKPSYVLGTTYTLSLAFFESVVFPCIDRSALRRCVIVADSFGFDRALDEAAALEGAGQDYLVAAAPTARCLHAKVWLMATDSEAVLLVGSGNLTQSGFVGNAELFDVLHITPSAPASKELIVSLAGFIEGLASLWPEGRAALACDALSDIAEAVTALPKNESAGDSDPRFLHSFQGALIDQLPMNAEPERLSIAAPFFGGELAGIGLLARRYPTARLRIFPAVHSDNTIDLPVDRLTTSFKGAIASRLRLDSKPSSFPHLKLYAAESKQDTPWLFCTSANCTAAALAGANIEAGILRRVARTSVKKYFVANPKPLPLTPFQWPTEGSSHLRLAISATDNGSAISLSVADTSSGRFPLFDVTVAVRSGNAVATTERASLFASGFTASIPWTAFEGWMKTRNRAIRVDVLGHTDSAEQVEGRAFLENRLLLTSDPVHRSAWRGALAMLNVEGVPELADIAAVFSLAHDVFNSTALPAATALSLSTPVAASVSQSGMAIWPPQPDLHELHRLTTKSSAGQLRWFQEIMRTLLSPPQRPVASTQGTDTGGDDPDADADEEQRLVRQERVVAIAERLWSHATRDYEKSYNRLHEMEPTAMNAPRIWPVAIFTFLATMAVLQASIRISAQVEWTSAIAEVVDDFLRLMFLPRRQSDDYCCPIGARYRHETFPPLSDDLKNVFAEHLHPDLSIVMLTALADQKMRSPRNKYALMWEQRLRQIWSKDFDCGTEAKANCSRIWERFLAAERHVGSTTAFSNALEELCDTAKRLGL